MSKALPFLKRHWLDIVLYAVVASLGVVGLSILPSFFSSSEAHLLHIVVSGREIETFDLTKEGDERSISVEGAHGLVIVGLKFNAAAILESPCPNQFCVHQGWSDDGTPIYCAYSELSLEFEGIGDLDAYL